MTILTENFSDIILIILIIIVPNPILFIFHPSTYLPTLSLSCAILPTSCASSPLAIMLSVLQENNFVAKILYEILTWGAGAFR